MKILINAAVAGRNSFSVVLNGWLTAWPNADDEIHVIAPRSWWEETQERLPRAPSVHWHEGGPAIGSRLRLQAFGLNQLTKAIRPDIVFCAYPSLGRATSGVPVVAVAYDFRHELRPEDFARRTRLWRRWQYNATYNRAAGIASISQRTADDMMALNSAWGTKSQTVHLGVDMPESEAVGGVNRVALAYAHNANKRPHLALQAWAVLKSTSENLPRLVVVGASGDVRLSLIELRGDLALGNEDISILGHVRDDDYEELWASCSVVVMPSTFEGFGLPVLEALARGIPVAITPEAAMIEVGGEWVEVSRDSTPHSLAEAVSRALSRGGPDFANGARRWVEPFSWSISASKLRDMFAEIAVTHLVDESSPRRPDQSSPGMMS